MRRLRGRFRALKYRAKCTEHTKSSILEGRKQPKRRPGASQIDARGVVLVAGAGPEGPWGCLGRPLGAQRDARRGSGGTFGRTGGTLGAQGLQNDAQRGPKRRPKGTKIGGKPELVLSSAPRRVFRRPGVAFSLTFRRDPYPVWFFLRSVEKLDFGARKVHQTEAQSIQNGGLEASKTRARN